MKSAVPVPYAMSNASLDGPRLKIYGCVERSPGVHLRAIERSTNFALGQLMYHLDRLERMGLVDSQRDAGFRRYYATSQVDRHEKATLGALRQNAPRGIALALLRHGDRTHKELQRDLGVAGSTVSFHLQRMASSHLVTSEKKDSLQLYRLTDPDAVRRNILRYAPSFGDPAVDAFVTAWTRTATRRGKDTSAFRAPPS